MNSKFVDHVIIYFRSGKGGDGARSFRREKHVPLGGPDGGDGGRGGHIILRGNRQLWTLLDLRYRKFIHAANGQQGAGHRKTGASGADEVLEVPTGTVVSNAETGELLCEMLEDGQQEILLHGGKGGLGNWHFRSATRQAPEYAQEGQPGQELKAVFELKVLADVGLVGFPNAGKSTLLAALSAAKPKIGDYPFTTLKPNLGIVALPDHRSFLLADIPGIIEGAHQGKGLGLNFLRHIERNAVLLFLVPADADDIAAQYRTLCNELEQYDPLLKTKPRLLAISKADLLDEELEALLQPHLPTGVETLFISSATGQGLTQLKERLYRLVAQEKQPEEEVPPHSEAYDKIPPHKRPMGGRAW